MTVIQQPDALSLSLSGNLKDFKIAAASRVSFSLKQGNDPVLSQMYDPGDDSPVSISLRDVIAARLSFLLKNTRPRVFYGAPPVS